jgi:copper homeostasis protein
MKLEVVVYNIESALKALDGGADRLEICASPGEGGTTPSFGVIEVIRQNVTCDVYVMIRPRGGDFNYSRYEFHAMKRDITQYQKISVDGFVLGILTTDGRIDKVRCRELIDRARPLKVTCHRAFDMTRDPFEALEDCIEVGFERILTSGHRTKAAEGIDLIGALVERAKGRIIIMPGSGVNEGNVEEISRRTRATEFHFSATMQRDSEMSYKNQSLAGMGSDSNSEYQLRTINPQIIRNIRAILAK